MGVQRYSLSFPILSAWFTSVGLHANPLLAVESPIKHKDFVLGMVSTGQPKGLSFWIKNSIALPNTFVCSASGSCPFISASMDKSGSSQQECLLPSLVSLRLLLGFKNKPDKENQCMQRNQDNSDHQDYMKHFKARES